MKHILVTGANGQLGKTFQEIASQYPGYQFTFTDVDELNITDADAVNQYLGAQTFDACINCAAYTAVDKAEADEDNAFLLNFQAPLFLAEACSNQGTQYIHISTDYVFDGKACVPYTEEDDASPSTIYGSSKMRGEAAALSANPSTVVIRTSWLYSKYGVNFVSRMQELMAEKESLSIVFDQVGTPTYALDLAKAILSILDFKYEKLDEIGGIYHYSNEGVASWYDFAVAIKSLSGSQCKLEPITSEAYPTAAERPSYSVLNKGKIKNVFGLEIPYWKDSLQACLGK